MRKAVTIWVLASAAGYLLQCRLLETGVLSLEMLPLADSDSPVHEAVRQGPAILLLGATPFFHGGAFHAFLGCVSLIAAGRLVEQVCGTRFTFFLLGAASILGSGAAWIVEGHPSFGASAPFFGLLGAMIVLVTRRVFPAPLIWNLSFPLLVLAGLFSLVAEEMRDVSHVAHLAAFLLGVGMVLLIPRKRVPTVVMAAILGAYLAVGGALGVAGGVRIAIDRGVDFRLSSLLGSSYDIFEDPRGRYRITYPRESVPVPSDDGLVLRMKGSVDIRLLTLEIEPRRTEEGINVVAREIIDEYRKGLGRVARADSIAILEEGSVSPGLADGWKAIISSSTADGDRTDIVIVARTEERLYILHSAYLDRDFLAVKWIRRILDSLEIIE